MYIYTGVALPNSGVYRNSILRNDQEKRLVWPLGRIREIIPGKDEVIRLARVETARGQLLRPIQRKCIDTKKALEPTSTLPPIDEVLVVQFAGNKDIVQFLRLSLLFSSSNRRGWEKRVAFAEHDTI
ncbi:hypothetical protein NQ315_003557 [Exocentrus adspersus]|uniref:DUF5641 domain-containing protein n=1 Tax=Exocentrus adspersus TaxID=1586481 RepID=A0AAV8VDD8_9CUCU|nr:hypothetical protein NQ315_003557 [Exocentrus adspersus]